MVDLSKLAKPNKTIREHTDELLNSLEILYKNNYISNKIYELMKIACEYHDYGKINDKFQARVISKGRIKFDEENEVAHNVLSLVFLDRKIFEKEEDYYKVAYAILNHHQHSNNLNAFSEKEEIINEFIKKYNGKKIKKRVRNEIGKYQNDIEAQLLKGFLHKCDYSASGEYIIEYPNNFLNKSLKEYFKNFGFEMNELQKFCFENKDKNLVVVANTGMGKTEAGLLWIDNNKGFFILPLRTAINAIYKRIIEKIVKENITERVSLLHSETLSQYLKESVVEEEKILEYSNKGKAMSMPLTITTPDQIFNFVYKYNGFELKLATLSYSKLVIDEIQAYSPDLLAYIILGLENIVKAGGKFAILTATFPPFIMNYLEEVLPKEKLPIYKKFIKDENKPSIRHFLEVKEKELDSQLIKEHFEKFGGKTLVICNTVKKSQQIYKELESFGLKDKIKLFHAKFTREDRKIKENEILKIGETEVKDNVIWITTSIVEASLDIDFDYLFTELNDINGLFQRLGRVNRKGLKQEMLNKPNAYLFTEIDKNILTNESGTRGFIDKTIYNISKKALLEVNGKLTEEKKVELIEKYLIYKDIKNSTFDKRYRDIKKYIESLYIGEKNYKDVQQKFRNIVSFDVIPLEIYEEEKNKKIILENEKILNIKYEKDINLSEEENNKRREKLKLLKIKAKEEIYKFVVSVGQYDINKTGIQVDIGYDKLEVVNCNYSFELGFERVKKENVESKDNDAFL